MKLRSITTACLLAWALPAMAAITLGNEQGGSSLFLSVWDATRNVSYTRNLGTNLNGFLPNSITTLPNDGNVLGTAVTGNKTPSAGLTQAFPGDALFTSTFSTSTASNILWNVVAFDNQSSTNTGLSRALVTASSAPATTNAGLLNLGNGGTQYLNALLADTSIASQNSVVATDPALASFAGNPNWGEGLNGANLSSAATGFGQTLDFYYLARTVVSGAGSTPATNVQYGNGTNTAKWSLATDGTATYNLAAAGVAAVPLPPAVGLLGLGLAAMWVVARRPRGQGAPGTRPGANEPCQGLNQAHA